MWSTTHRLVLATLLLIAPFIATAQWEIIPSPGATGVNSLALIGNKFFAVSSRAILRSDDFGYTWETVPTPFIGQLGDEIRQIREHKGVLYVMRGNNSPQQLWSSSDGGQSWQQNDFISIVTVGENEPDLSFSEEYVFFYAMNKLWRARLDMMPNAIWEEVASSLSGYGIHDEELWINANFEVLRSKNWGISWDTLHTAVSDRTTFAFHGDTILMGTDYVCFRSVDNGQTWSEISFDPDQIYSKVAYRYGRWYALNDFAGASDVYVSDNAFFSRSLLANFNLLIDGRSVHRIGGLLLAPGTTGCWMSIDGGTTWNLRGTRMGEPSAHPNFIRVGKYVMMYSGVSPHNFNTLTWISADEGETWYRPASGSLWSNSQHLVVERNGAYFVTSGNKVYRSTNELTTWERIDVTGLPAQKLLSLFCDDQYWYADASPGPGIRTLYRSSDGGLTWTQVGNLPFSPVHTVFFNNRLFASTTDGRIWVSEDFGQTWNLRFDLPGTVNPVKSLLVDQNVLYCFTNNTLARCDDNEGTVWTTLNQKLLNSIGIPMTLTRVEVRKGNIFVSGDGGQVVMMSKDNGATWGTILNKSTSIPYYFDLLVQGDYLIVSGGGIYWRRAVNDLDLASVNGLAFWDQNFDLIPDSAEYRAIGMPMYNQDKSYWSCTDNEGSFKIYAVVGDTIFPAHPPEVAVAIPPYFVVGDTVGTINFALQPKPNLRDLAVNLNKLQPFQPGFEAVVAITVHNRGTMAEAARVLYLPDPKLEILEVVPAAAYTSNDTIVWEPNIQPLFGKMSFLAKVRVPAATPIGTGLQSEAWVRPNEDDLHPENNHFFDQSIVVGSYDPNDKQASPDIYTVAAVQSGERLFYTIRFQNTGTYPATFVRITDTIALELDLTTLRIESSSHQMVWSLRGSGIAEFYFPEIFLPDSLSNEPASHGWVTYSIAGRKNLEPGTPVRNTAYIYFDYNLAVQTNTTETIVTAPSGTSMPERLANGGLILLPNPGSEEVRCLFPQIKPNEAAILQVFNRFGQLITEIVGANPETVLHVGTWPAGAYVVIVRNGTQWYSECLIKR